jgi:glycolate oxidase iron-sulfur subunit
MKSATAFAPEQRFLDCVHCGLCLAACPTYVENSLEADSPRGRIYLMKGLQDGKLAATRETVRHLDLCLACRACETACPSGVRYGALIEAARPSVESRFRNRTAWERWRREAVARLIARPGGQRWLARAAMLLPRRFLGHVARFEPLPAALRYRAALAAALPRPTSAPLPQLLEPGGRVRGSVALLTGCLTQTFFGPTNQRAAALLVHAGFRVHVPPEPVCCGALLQHLGRRDEAMALARRTVAVFQPLRVDAIVVTAAGCGAMLQSYADILDDVASAATGARARDVTAVLADAGLPTPPRRLERRVTYHDACHLLHGQGVRSAPRKLLESIPGIELADLGEADYCCGSAGTYNLTEPVMARRLMERKTDHILATGAPVVAAANPGCLLQIRAGLAYRGASVDVVHPVDLLAEAHFGTDERQGPASG